MEMTSDVDEIMRLASQVGLSNDSDVQARLTPPVRNLHRAVLRAFLASDGSPGTTWLREKASAFHLEPDEAILALAEADLVHVDGDNITVAYPFSGIPTNHKVGLGDDRTVWAMCALDALGVLSLIDSDGRVHSSDPDTGAPIRVERSDGQWRWEPTTAVLLLAFSDAATSSDEGLCPHIDFHVDAKCADEHLRANSGLIGLVVEQCTAIELADRVFGGLLHADE